MDQKARLQTLEQEQHKELVKLRAQQAELGEAKVMVDTLRAQLEREIADAVLAKETLSEQTMQLNTALSRVKMLERDTRSQETALNDALQELEELRKKSADFDMIRDTELSKLRKEWTAKHFETQAQWKKDTEDRLQTMEMEVRSQYESVLISLQNQLNDVTAELESTKQELDRTANDYEESLKARQSLTEKVAQLERDYREVRTKSIKDRRTYEETLERFKSSKISKEREFNDLMDVKIALDAEIMKYRRILDREESRVAVATPNTKGRKRKIETPNSTVSKRAKRTIFEPDYWSSSVPAVEIASFNLKKDCIVLKNNSSEPVPLGGYSRLTTPVVL